MAQEIRRIGPLSAAKIAAVVYGLMGLTFLPFFMVVRSFAPSDPAMPGIGMGFGMGFVIAMPFVYAAMGFVFTLIGAALYNLVAGWVGGLEIELR